MKDTKEEVLEIIKKAFTKDSVDEGDLEELSKTLSASELNASVDVNNLVAQLKQLLSSLENKTKDNVLAEIDKREIIQHSLQPSSQKKLGKQFNTKCENIIEKLKEIRQEALNQKDNASVLDIDWVIKTLNEENIYELDPLVVNDDSLNTEENKNGIDYLMQYSKIEDMKQRTKDLTLVRSNNSRSRTFSSSENAKILSEGFDEEKLSKRRESAVLSMSSVLSPSVSEKIITTMKRIAYCDFDIFSLDELMNEQVSMLVASEILNSLDFVKDGFVEPTILKDFIQVVAMSYNRKNAIYHNDLHAADVMQTLFTMMVRGDLQNVRLLFNE